MLTEPPADEERLALEQAVAVAARARLAAGGRGSLDGDAIALRAVLGGMGPAEKAAVRAVLGRLEAAAGRPLVACGALAQVLAADRWGLAARPLAEADQALTAAREGARALIDLSTRPWWGRLLALPMLKVIAALPDDAAGSPRALMVSTETPGPTGDDRTFWVTDSAWPDARIVEALGQAGLAAEFLAGGGGLKLFVLTGYVQAEDPRLAGAPGGLTGVIGAAPVF
ncbi:hypothetical protein D8I30_06650 [Brevundimonas naejangsanensis]|uniref:Chorismate mutase n=1 Tax=Brevundimonas naejangsanensis TaxID=588932 RepID=A0A494RN73_9CAUL|nr:hypothetical protein [Brevundimonas naejangsanensis]AYG94896.1 hypothetical protein D8I30_06650 [Brevundimonas naejangsanensis]